MEEGAANRRLSRLDILGWGVGAFYVGGSALGVGGAYWFVYGDPLRAAGLGGGFFTAVCAISYAMFAPPPRWLRRWINRSPA